ncbi:MAG: hypothetical protein M3301_04805 [Chloroflexota bacterium]|nr:hypothetical protein [Chloroflexota bacterium]
MSDETSPAAPTGGTKWGPPRREAAPSTGLEGPETAEPSADGQEIRDAGDQGNFGEGIGVEAPSQEGSVDPPGSNRGDR